MDVALDDLKKSRLWMSGILESVEPDYDVVFLDCAPSISTTSESVFHAVDALLVPLIPTTLSMRTLDQLRAHLGKADLQALPVWPFFSMVDRRKKMHRDFLSELASDESYFKTAIPNASQVERMGVERCPVPVFAGGTVAAKSYLNLWGEIEERFGLVEPRVEV